MRYARTIARRFPSTSPTIRQICTASSPFPCWCCGGERSHVNRSYKPIEAWQERASDVRGRMLPCGHYPAEQAPDETGTELVAFFKDERVG